MNHPLGSDVHPIEEAVSETTNVPPAGPRGSVTYTLKVLSARRDAEGNPVRTVLFQRASAGEAIEISAETDAPNLLAEIPELLEAALQIQRTLRLESGGVSPLASVVPVLAEESRLVRRLAEGDRPLPEPPRRGVLRLIGVAYRSLSRSPFTTVARPGAPRARGWGALRLRGRRRGR
jgi:hypothetical protein